MVEVVWTDSAISDLNDIGDFIAKDSERYAEITVDKLFNSVDILEMHPRSGKMCHEFQNEKIRELMRWNYRIVYHIVNESKIDILTVHKCDRLIENTFDFTKIIDE